MEHGSGDSASQVSFIWSRKDRGTFRLLRTLLEIQRDSLAWWVFLERWWEILLNGTKFVVKGGRTTLELVFEDDKRQELQQASTYGRQWVRATRQLDCLAKDFLLIGEPWIEGGWERAWSRREKRRKEREKEKEWHVWERERAAKREMGWSDLSPF